MGDLCNSRVIIQLASVVLVKGWTHKSMSPNGEFRNRITEICPSDFFIKVRLEIEFRTVL